MQKNNTFSIYHGRIIKNIQTFDQRKDTYINTRLSHITILCQPLKSRIEFIKKKIKYYQNLRDNQYQIIQTDPQILQLKQQISSYLSTSKYYQNMLDQFDQCIAKLQTHLQQSYQYLSQKKLKYKFVIIKKGPLFHAHHLAQKQTKIRQNNTLAEKAISSDHQSSKASNVYLNHSLAMKENSTVQQKDNIQKLPKIDKNKWKKYHIQAKRRKFNRHQKNIQRLQQFIENSQPSYHSLQIHFQQQQGKEFIQLNTNTIKEIKQLITQFDYTETLFRDCFERKKFYIQRSVSQLQPKLISNKDLFLTACKKISQKQGSLSFDEFCSLSTDQIVTLFVSFGWLNRKIYSQFTQKRKKFIDVLKLLKHIEQTK